MGRPLLGALPPSIGATTNPKPSGSDPVAVAAATVEQVLEVDGQQHLRWPTLPGGQVPEREQPVDPFGQRVVASLCWGAPLMLAV